MTPPPLPPLPRADLERTLTHTAVLWREMAGARLFITGGTGFVGRWLLESLAWANARLGVGVRASVLSRDPAAFSRAAPHLAGDRSITVHRGDVREFDPPEDPFTHVVHGAFDSGKAIASPHDAFDTLVGGTRRVVEFAERQPLERMLYVSSGAIYGPQPATTARLAEGSLPIGPDPLLPSSAYAEGKRVGELFCALAAERGLPVSIARCFAFIGPGLPLDAHFAAGNFLRDACQGRDIVVTGDGTPVRSYLYAADLATWLWTILLRGRPGRAYNVGDDQPVSIGQLAGMIAARTPGHPRVRVLGQATGVPPQRYVPDIGRARSELNLRPSVPLDEAIGRTIDWLAG